MRPVDQVVENLRKAQEEADRANAVVAKFKAELQQIHEAVEQALGIKKQTYRTPLTAYAAEDGGPVIHNMPG